jgi:Ni/Co efflux regulator RcnB
MSAIINSEMISRRKALSLMGLAAAFGLAAAPTVLTASDAEAQTAGMERRQERRTGRHERREERREGTTTGTGTGTTTGTGTGQKQ